MAFFDNLPELLEGAWVTIQITVLSIGLALVLALIAGTGMLSKRWVVRLVSRTYTEFFRGVSVLVLLFWFFFSLPTLGVSLTPLTAAVLALGLNIGAYEAEIVRGAVQSVPRGQWEAARALNMSPTLRLRRIILPQALPLMIPPYGNMTIQLLKATALVSLVPGVADITFEAQQARGRGGDTAEVFLGILFMYLVLAYLITLGMRWLERRVRVERA